MYVEKKKIGNKKYMYLKISARDKDRTKTKTIAYLGKEPMSKKELKKKISSIPKSTINKAKKELKKALSQIGINKEFLTQEQLTKLNQIKKDYTAKLKIKDKILIQDMFKDFKTEFIYNTNAIEGNTLTLNETGLLLNQNKTPNAKDLREIHDHINAKEVFDLLLQNKPEITIKEIIEIHKTLLKNIDKRVGNFRTHQVRVFGSDFKTTEPKYIKIDMDLLLKWYKKEKNKLHPIVLAAIFHEKYERIHPFYDGNGRSGRMLLNLILIKNNLPPIIIQNKDRLKYYEVLSNGHKAQLTETDPKHYKDIVQFCYNQLIKTYKKIFSNWG